MPVVDTELTRQFIYRRAEAKQLLEWSRTIEQHKLAYEVWLTSAAATASSNPPQHTKTRNGRDRLNASLSAGE